MRRNVVFDMMKLSAAFCVVMVHSDYLFRVYGTAVPSFLRPAAALANTGNTVFMMVSGYLLYTRNEPYGKNLKKKIRSILVPLVLWNILWIIAEMIGHRFLPYRFENVADWTALRWLEALFGVPFLRDPYYMPFWFLIDLFALNVLAPVIRWLCRRVPAVYAAGLAVLWFLPLSYRIRIPFVFFSAGCFFAEYAVLREHIRSIPAVWCIVPAVAAGMLVWFRYDDLTVKLTILMFLPVVYRFCRYFSTTGAGQRLLGICLPYLIVIYAVHAKILIVFQKNPAAQIHLQVVVPLLVHT